MLLLTEHTNTKTKWSNFGKIHAHNGSKLYCTILHKRNTYSDINLYKNHEKIKAACKLIDSNICNIPSNTLINVTPAIG